MLQIKKLNLTHKKDLRIILNDFNLVLNDGDKAVIIGEEGNGKSTLMKWIYNPSLVENYIEADGERIMGHERLGYLPQEMLDEDKEKTIYEYFSEEEIFWEKTPKELSVIAGKFGMKNDFFYSNQTMGSLSGGEKVKTQLMRLFIRDVSVLLLDEPSNDIDIATLTLLEKIINDWKHIVLFISHDETLIERTANMVIHIEQIIRKTKARYTVAKLPYRRYVEERLHKFEKAKVLLLRMSLSGANVLILDEPTRNFSPLSGPVIRKMLREFPGAVISISHDRKYIEEVCDKIYQLNPNGLQLIGD